MDAKDENFILTFAALKNPDVDEDEMQLSEYSSKYALCIYNYRSYDLRDLSRKTREEYDEHTLSNVLEKSCKPDTISFTLQKGDSD